MEASSDRTNLGGAEDEPGCTLRDLPAVLASNSGNSSSALRSTLCTFEGLYTKVKHLRSGSYGAVYTCLHKKRPETAYAVKIMDREKLKPNDVASVFREVAILNELTQSRSTDDYSPMYFVELIDFFEDSKMLYVVQMFAAGGDVFDRLSRRQQYTERDARTLAKNLIESIHFLHTFKSSSGAIVHRDLKPENLLLLDHVDDTEILVADFGFARHLVADTNERCRTRCGTPAYVSPELLLGLPYDFSVDLWSIGCVIYMLVAGYPPFKAENHRALFRKIRDGDFVFHGASWKNVSIEAKQLITHLLTVNVSKRWTAKEALECAWFKKSDEQLALFDLSGTLIELKHFDAKAAWKRAVNALGFCSTAPFWKPDAISFAQQLVAWDNGPGSEFAMPRHMHVSAPPRVMFSDLYEMGEQLGEGKYSTVWVCEHVPSATVHAVKVIQRKGLKREVDEAVLNEVAVMQSLCGTKYVVQLLDFYEEEDCFYLVMEYCAGGDVFDRVVQFVQYTENDARGLALSLLNAVKSIHDAGIAHRDIKPQNILLLSDDDNVRIRVADFGFARRIHSPESLSTIEGTPTYVAPEILGNKPHDHRVDLWSVGVVIFVLMVGYPPFVDEDQTTLFHKIRNGMWAFDEIDWKHISKDAKIMIKALLTKNPDDRWSVEKCLRSEWIMQDPIRLSSVNLSASLIELRKQKLSLRGAARAVMYARNFARQGDDGTHDEMEVGETS